MSVTSSHIQKNVDLAPYNTLNIHAKARHFVEVHLAEELASLLGDSRWSDEQVYILGGGSNVLFTADYDGLIIHNAISGKEVIKENDDFIWLRIGAGENWHETVRYCVEKGWGGIENLSLIPGTVGAAPIQNIGAYGVELQDTFAALSALEMQSGKQRRFNREECQFGYRNSIFKQALKGWFAVTDVTLKLAKKPILDTSYGAIRQNLDQLHIDEPSIADISDVVMQIRNSKLPDPAELANAGSFFKNPIVKNQEFEKLKADFPSMPGYGVDDEHTKIPAGWLIEQTGWKGKEAGNVGTYRQQALVIVNHGGATGAEILQVSRQIQQSVSEKFDITLVPEVNIVS